MNHKILISKYLDGDLTYREDKELRSLLAGDAAAKSEFNSAVALHLAMMEKREEDNLSAEELIEIERAILSRVQTFHHEKRLSPKVFSLARRLSAVAAILLIVAVPVADMRISYNIDSQSFNAHGQSGNKYLKIMNKLALSSANKADDSKTRVKVKVNHANEELKAVDKINIEINEAQSVTSEYALNINEQNIARRQMNDAVGQTPNHSAIPAESVPTVLYIPSLAEKHAVANSNIGDECLAPASREANKSTDVQLTTFVGNGVIKIGKDLVAAAASVSQSIGYSIGKSSIVGIEVGYTGYSIADAGTIAVPVLGRNSKGGVQGAGDNGYPMSSSQNEHQNTYETKSVGFTSNKKLYWSSAFYEHTLLDNGNLAVNARLGAGGSPEGPMMYGRAFARYTIVSGISVTLGAESRLQTMLTSPLKSMRSEEISGVSVVYGAQIKF